MRSAGRTAQSIGRLPDAAVDRRDPNRPSQQRAGHDRRDGARRGRDVRIYVGKRRGTLRYEVRSAEQRHLGGDGATTNNRVRNQEAGRQTLRHCRVVERLLDVIRDV